MEEVPEAHLVGTLEMGARERLRDEEALHVRALEGVPLVRTEAPVDETRSVVRSDDRHVVRQAQPARPRVSRPEAHERGSAAALSSYRCSCGDDVLCPIR